MKKRIAFLFITAFGFGIGYLIAFSFICLKIYLDGFVRLEEPNTLMIITEMVVGFYTFSTLIYLFHYFTKNADRMK